VYNGLINPGCSPGKVTVTGNFTMGSGATYEAELKDLTGSGTGHDQIDISGNLNLDGTLDIALDGYTPNASDEFQILKFDGTLSGTFSTINWAGTMLAEGWQIDYGVLIPNRITIYGANSVIPIELLNFTVNKQKENLILLWQTASEKNSDYFDIEHSITGNEFSKLESITAQGTSHTIQDYSYIHNYPTKGINYYRLKQVDLDGKYTYSKTISANFGKEELSFYPNPATEILHFTEKVESLVIYDLMGREMLNEQQVGKDLDISQLPTGTYIMDINNGLSKQNLMVK